MWEPIAIAVAMLTGGIISFNHLDKRIDRVEDKADKHIVTLDKKVDDLNREVGEVKVIVQRMEQKLDK